MTLSEYIKQKHYTQLYLSEVSKVPYSTIKDVCAGRSSLKRCSAKTVYKISNALKCTMEDLMLLDDIDKESRVDIGVDNEIAGNSVEQNLPEEMKNTLDKLKKSWELQDQWIIDKDWLIHYMEFEEQIKTAEKNNIISAGQSQYLQKKYLRKQV